MEDEMREKLIELMREGAMGHTFMPTERIADHLLANGVTLKSECESCGKAASDTIVGLQETIKELRDAQGLIPVSERLPENGQQVIRYHGLAWNPKKTAAFYYEGDEKLYGWSDVTHWWPVPEPPKKEA